jgi:hypothetical protein
MELTMKTKSCITIAAFLAAFLVHTSPLLAQTADSCESACQKMDEDGQVLITTSDGQRDICCCKSDGIHDGYQSLPLEMCK